LDGTLPAFPRTGRPAGVDAVSETYYFLSNLAAAGAAAVFLYLIFWG